MGRLFLRRQELGAIAIGMIGILFAGYIAIKWWQQRRFYDTLRVPRITVDELHRLIAEGQRQMIVDLRTSLARHQNGNFIPGSVMEILRRWINGSTSADKSRGHFLLHLPRRAGNRSHHQKVDGSRLHARAAIARRSGCLDCGRLSSRHQVCRLNQRFVD
jgi:hypothetical protein